MPVAAIHHVNAHLAEIVHDTRDAHLVSGDRLGREQEQVALRQRQPLIFPARQLGRGRAAFALTAGHDQHQVLARMLDGLVRADGRREIGQNTAFHARLDHPPHRPPQKTDRPARPLAGFRQCLDPRDVRRERRRHHHARRILPPAPRYSRPRLPRTGRDAAKRHWWNRRQARERRPSPHPPTSARSKASPTTGVSSILKSPVCTIRPAGVSITSAEASGIECDTGRNPTLNGPALTWLGQGSAVRTSSAIMALIVHLASRDIGREPPRMDLRPQPAPEMAHRAHVILMRMGDEDRLDPVGPLGQPLDIGKDQIDARRAVHIGECHAQIDDDQPLLVRRPIAVDIAIHPDLPRASKGKINQPVAAHAACLSLLYLWMMVSPCIVRSSSNASNSASDC